MMNHECLNAFPNWVARRQNSKPIENLSCPLTGCTEKDFKNFESYLQHVFARPDMLAGKYRCSYCKREECYIPSNVKAYKFGKCSKLGDAVTTFFKQFGRKNSLDPGAGLNIDAEIPEFNTDAGICELQASSAVPEICTKDLFVPLTGEPLGSSTQWSELVGASDSKFYQNELPSLETQRPELHGSLTTWFGAELSSTRSYIDPSGGPESESWYDDSEFDAETASVAFQSSQQSDAAPEDWHSAMASPGSLPLNRSKSHSYYQYSASDEAGTDTGYIDSDQCRNSPSKIGSWSAKRHNSMHFDLVSSVPRGSSRLGSMTPGIPGGSHLKLDIPWALSSNPENLQSHKQTAPQPSSSSLGLCYNKPCLIEYISQVVNSLEDLSKQKLRKSPELSAKTSQLHSSPTLQGGLRVLKRFFDSNLTSGSTTKELVQITHIAFACAFKSQSENGWYPWEALYQDALRWGQSITEPEDRSLYFQIIRCLWSLPENLRHNAGVSIPKEVDMHLYESNDVGNTTANNVDVIGPSSDQSLIIPSQDTHDRVLFLSHFESGIMIRSCTSFLDGMKPNFYEFPAKLRHRMILDPICAEVFERNGLGIAPTVALRGFTEGANQIVELLLKPLLQDQRFEVFHAHVRATLQLLYDGTLLSVREVEALLMAKHHVRHLRTEKEVLENNLLMP